MIPFKRDDSKLALPLSDFQGAEQEGGKKEKTLTRAFWVVDNLHINVKVMFVCFLLLSFFLLCM